MNGKTVLITGGTAGIGLELARLLSLHHQVIVTGRRPADDIRDLLPESAAYCEAALDEPADATAAIASALEDAGIARLDHAILNAGTGFAARDGIDPPDAIRRTLDVNLVSAVLLSRALFPFLERAGGTLTLIGSVAHGGQSLFPAYAASKAGLHGFSRALRSEWAGRARVQIIHPGPTRTGMHEKAGHDPGRLARLFVPADAMAGMIADAIAAGKSPVTLSFGSYWRTLASRRKAGT